MLSCLIFKTYSLIKFVLKYQNKIIEILRFTRDINRIHNYYQILYHIYNKKYKINIMFNSNVFSFCSSI